MSEIKCGHAFRGVLYKDGETEQLFYCRGCGRWLPLDNFHIRKSRLKTGEHLERPASRCLTCAEERRAKRSFRSSDVKVNNLK